MFLALPVNYINVYKYILTGTGYKLKDLENLEVGQTLVIGGKEIEVMGSITAEDYTSGRCFHSGVVSPTHAPQDFLQIKPFTNPMKNVSKETMSKDIQTCKPRHDPSTPGTNGLHLMRSTLVSIVYYIS